MIEIRYGEQYEVTDLAGKTVSEAREQFRDEFGIPDNARAKLNGNKIKGSAELDTVLNDDDKLSFAAAKSRAPFLVGALLLAMAITGGVFAFGFINASSTLTGAVIHNANFADVTANTDGFAAISWEGYGFFKGALESTWDTDYGTTDNGTPIYNVDTVTSTYDGDLVVTVTLGNVDQLAKKYRVLALRLAMEDSDNVTMDINESGVADEDDWVMLTLDNGTVSMFPQGIAGGDNMTVRLMSGFFITHVKPNGTWGGAEDPQLFCEVAQR